MGLNPVLDRRRFYEIKSADLAWINVCRGDNFIQENLMSYRGHMIMTSIKGDLDKMEPIPSKLSIDRLSRNSLKHEKFSDSIRESAKTVRCCLCRMSMSENCHETQILSIHRGE